MSKRIVDTLKSGFSKLTVKLENTAVIYDIFSVLSSNIFGMIRIYLLSKSNPSTLGYLLVSKGSRT